MFQTKLGVWWRKEKCRLSRWQKILNSLSNYFRRWLIPRTFVKRVKEFNSSMPTATVVRLTD